MMDIKEVLLVWFVNVLTKSLQLVVLNKMNNSLKNHINQLLECFFFFKYIYHLNLTEIFLIFFLSFISLFSLILEFSYLC